MDRYKINDSSEIVKIEVLAGTVGIAETRVYLRIAGGFEKIHTSEELNNGNIPPSKVETNENLLGALIQIRTVINFSNIPENERPKAIENILMEYYLDGGPSGRQKYLAAGLDILPVGKTIVVVTKQIRFI